MSQIEKKSGNAMTERDPFRSMREMLRWDPFREMTPAFAWNPSFEVTENKDGFLFTADLPGIKPEDLEITVTGNRLQIAGKRDAEKETKNDAIYTYEREYGSFARAFTLPEGADLEHVKTELEGGVLKLVVPRSAAAPTKRIPVSTTPKS